jgi:hypothetical protein
MTRLKSILCASLVTFAISSTTIAGNISVGKTSVGNISVGAASTGNISVGAASTGNISVGAASTGNISIGKAENLEATSGIDFAGYFLALVYSMF